MTNPHVATLAIVFLAGGRARVRASPCSLWVCRLGVGRFLPPRPKTCIAPCISLLVVVQSLSRVRLFVTPWTAAHQASLSITNSWSLLKLMSVKSVMPSSHLILCRPLLLLPSVSPSIRVFSNESTLGIRWPKYWKFSIRTFNEYSGLISSRIDWSDLAVQ